MVEMFSQQAKYMYCRTAADCYSIGTCHGSGAACPWPHGSHTAVQMHSIKCVCLCSEKLAPSRVPEETHARKYLVLQGSLFQD